MILTYHVASGKYDTSELKSLIAIGTGTALCHPWQRRK
jgi:uncharacterized surface protein with fasciclin (FAS1) repeats